MANLKLMLLVAAFILFVLSAVPYPPSNPYWNRLVGAGLACWVASILFG